MNKRYKNFLYYWFPVLIYCLLIYLQSSYPSPDSVPDLPYLDKLIHLAVYALLGILFFRAYMTQSFKDNIKLVMALSIVSSSLYGVSDEIHQYYVTCRSAELMDVLADILGSICGVFAYQLIIGKGQSRLHA